MAMEESKVTKMKTFRIEEKFTGYAEVTIEAETEEEALALYKRGGYPDSDYVMDDMFYDFEFQQISERRQINDNKLPEMDRAITQ